MRPDRTPVDGSNAIMKASSQVQTIRRRSTIGPNICQTPAETRDANRRAQSDHVMHITPWYFDASFIELSLTIA